MHKITTFCDSQLLKVCVLYVLTVPSTYRLHARSRIEGPQQLFVVSVVIVAIFVIFVCFPRNKTIFLFCFISLVDRHNTARA